MAKVSKKTVSRVINQSPLVKEDTRARVAEVIRQSGFVPDPQARGLAFRRSFLMGLVYDNPNAQFVVNSQYGILDGLRGSGVELVVHPCDRRSPTLLADVRAFVERQRLFGVVLLPPVSENEALIDILRELDCAYVRIASADLDEPGFMVASHDQVGTSEAAAHLLGLGHRRIAVIKGPAGYRSAQERWSGFRAELQRAGIDLPDSHVVEGGYTFESGVECAERLLALEPRPTAIFASNDEMAAGVYHVANLRGLPIPEELSVVGFDDTPLAARMWPPLTTVSWPIQEMGRTAARLLLAQARGEDDAMKAAPVEPRLTVRASTAAKPS
jgi:LacI family transcriptional regulator